MARCHCALNTVSWETQALTVRVVRQNADPDVRHDMETFLNATVPEVRSGTLQLCQKEAKSDTAWHNRFFPVEMSMPHHGIDPLMRLHRHFLQGRKAPWIHTAEGDDDMPGAFDDCTVNVREMSVCDVSLLKFKGRQMRPIIRQSVLWAGALPQEIVACRWILRLYCMCSTCKIIHVWLLTGHSHIKWAPQPGDMAGVQSLACSNILVCPALSAQDASPSPAHAQNDTSMIQAQQVAYLSSHTLALPEG